MTASDAPGIRELTQRLSEAEATIQALLTGQVDAVVDAESSSPLLLSKAQEALRESAERYRILFEKSPMPKWLYDAESLRFLAVNDAAIKHYGYSREEFMRMTIKDIRPPDDVEKMVRVVDAARPGPGAFGVWKHRTKDGTLIDVEVTGHTFPLEGRATLLVVAQDITARMRTEAALRASEAQYRQIVETTTDGILKTDSAATIVFVNGRCAKLLGYEPTEMIGRSVFAFMSPAAQTVAACALESRRHGVQDATDTTLRHKNGTDIEVNVAGTPLFDGEGKHAGSLAVVRDTTERNKLQSQLMVSDRMASVGTLAAGVAHEINNPLAVVTANLDYIAESVEGMVAGDSAPGSSRASSAWFLEEIKAPLDDARDAAERVRLIVRDLKIFSRSPADEPSGSVDVKTTMESSLRMGWNEIRHRARLVKSYGAVPGVAANEARLGQVFLNLIVNAAQALPEGRAEHNEIHVSTRVDGERVIIEVSDTGPGIPPEIIGRIFDAFFTTKAVGVGTGLGLAICQRIVTDMGGELTVESELGKGTTFRVALPAARAAESIAAAAPLPVPIPGRRGRILVVDDEAMVVKIVKRVLAKEHDVVAVVSAKEALALFARGEKFDLVLCDLMMPDMTGMELHAETSRVDPDQAKRMVFMTGGAFTPAARTFLAETPQEHIEKPFHHSDLRALVRRHLRSFAACG